MPYHKITCIMFIKPEKLAGVQKAVLVAAVGVIK
jgi:hypothetical protein